MQSKGKGLELIKLPLVFVQMLKLCPLHSRVKLVFTLYYAKVHDIQVQTSAHCNRDVL